MTLAVFDIDGVVADVRHRVHHLQRSPKDWVRFFEAAEDDPPLPEGLALVSRLAAEHEIAWLTGRPEWLRELTRTWLTRQGLPGDELHMRPTHDRRPAPLFKLGVLRHLQPRGIAAFVDDDGDVIDSAVRAGYPAVVADWVPRPDAIRQAQDRLGRT